MLNKISTSNIKIIRTNPKAEDEYYMFLQCPDCKNMFATMPDPICNAYLCPFCKSSASYSNKAPPLDENTMNLLILSYKTRELEAERELYINKIRALDSEFEGKELNLKEFQQYINDLQVGDIKNAE